MAVGHAKEHTQTGLQMNMVFFGMSVVVLVVMIISMWKDTHPAWMAYQDRFAKIEHQVLTDRRNDLERQLNHPDYLADYTAAKAKFDSAKTVSDTASGKLEGTEADLEELELQLRGPDTEGEPAKAIATSKLGAATPSKADDMAELDQALKGGDSKPAGSKKTEPPKAASKSNSDDMAELDQAIAGDKKKQPVAPKQSKETPAAPKQNKETPAAPAKGDDMADLDKELAKEGTKGPASAPASKAGSTDDMAELDKEAQKSADQTPSTSSQTPTPEAKPTPPAPDFSEADLPVNQLGAGARLEAAERDLLEAQRVHSREMIGLPKDAELDRKHSELKLTEAEETVALSKAAVELENCKAEIKSAAEVARWARDFQEIGKLDPKVRTADQTKELETATAKLAEHKSNLERDLRLVSSRLTRNMRDERGVQQAYVERLSAVDRCQTCHLAIDDPMFSKVQQPFRSHPGSLLKLHPGERFGCVSCHAGFGNALDKNEAHGGLIGKGTQLKVGEQVQASCGKCHGDPKGISSALTYLSGKSLFQTSGCVGCHKVEELQKSLKAGPSLDSVAVKLSTPWLVKWLENPQSHSVEARMPNLGLTLNESQAITAYLMTQYGNSPIPPSPTPAPLSAADMIRAKRFTESLGCLGCHTIKGQGSNIGPELTNVRSKVRADWLYAWLLDPQKYLANSRMPNFRLDKAQAELIGNYLLTLGMDLPVVAAPPPDLLNLELAKRGGMLIAERGCAGCHDVKGFARLAAPELTRIGDKTVDVLEFGDAKGVKKSTFDWLFNKVLDPKTFDTKTFKSRMPKFGLDEGESRAIAVYLSSLTSVELPPEYQVGIGKQDAPLEAGRRLFADKDCGACHRISGEGGRIGPELTREGEMVQPGWLFKFLKRPERIRWWQDARMPDYNLTDAESTTLTEYLMALASQEAPYVYTPPEQLVYPLASAGKKYFTVLKCQSCHPLAGKQLVAGGDVKKIGPDLGMAPRRLKASWMMKFFIDPQAFTPGTQMPTYGKPDYEYRAIIDFLMKGAP